MIEFRGVTKRFPDGTVAVDDLDLTVRDGGDHGLRRAVRLRQDHVAAHGQPHDRARPSGTILVDGTDVMTADAAELRRGIGYVIQQAGLFPHRTIVDNVATVPLLLGWSKKKARDRAVELMEIVGLDPGDGAPLPGAALRRPAAARRRGPRARRRPAGAADGRAVQRGRPGGPREPAGRAAAAAGRAGQDDRVRHPRHRRGGQARRPGRGAPRRRQARPVRRARRAARPAGRRLRRRASSAATAATAASASCPSDAPAAAASCAPSALGEPRPSDGAWTLVVDADAAPAGLADHDRRRAAARSSTPNDLVPGGSLYDTGSGSLRSALDAALSSPSGQGVAVDGDGRVVGAVARGRRAGGARPPPGAHEAA